METLNGLPYQNSTLFYTYSFVLLHKLSHLSKMAGQMPMMVMSESNNFEALRGKSRLANQTDMGPERQSGRKAQTANIVAAKVSYHTLEAPKSMELTYQTVADVIRTCLGPKAMLKMILDPMGGILSVHILARR